jgi:N-acetylglucosaminyldiphosphoundecaprenol N-acetyl-beta-D-mannosaminyltransferase
MALELFTTLNKMAIIYIKEVIQMAEILGYKIFSNSKDELLTSVFQNNEKVNIISGNPEVLYNGLMDEQIHKNFNNDSSIIIPDGIGVVYTSKLIKDPVREKIAGIEVMEEIIQHCEKYGKGVYLLGADQSVVENCRIKLLEKYPKLNIAGVHNGFFDIDDCESLIDEINTASVEALFVAMGSPKQDRFIIKYMPRLNVKIFMGVGGSFDVISGKINRAPDWMLKYNLEWLYRVSKEPFRIKRLGAIPKFMWKALKYKRKTQSK